MTVDEFIKSEKSKLTVWARYERIMLGPVANHPEAYWRHLFETHQFKAERHRPLPDTGCEAIGQPKESTK